MSGSGDIDKSLFSTATMLGPRLRRYVMEIDQVISRACSSDPNRDVNLHKLEAVSTVPGLRSQILALEVERAKLQKENADLKSKVNGLHDLETQAAKADTLQRENESLQVEIQRLQQELLDNTDEYRARYDELKAVTNKITATANEAMTISEKRQQEVEKLQSENAGLQAQVEAIKLHLQSLIEEHKSYVDNSEAENASARQKIDVLEQSLFKARQSHMKQLEEVTESYQQTMAELQGSIRCLRKSEGALKTKVTELENSKSETSKEGSAATLWRQAAKAEMLQQKNAELEKQIGSLRARLAAVTEHTESMDVLQAQKDKLLTLVNEWRNVAAGAVAHAGSDQNIESITPERLREELQFLLKYKSRFGGQLDQLRISNLELETQLEQNRSELRRAQLLLSQERLSRSAAELEAAARAGEATTQRELLESWKRELDVKSSTDFENELKFSGNSKSTTNSLDPAVTLSTAVLSIPAADLNHALAEKISQWKCEMQSLLTKYQEELDSTTSQLTPAEQRLKLARKQLITLETMIDTADVRREELQVIVQRQKTEIDEMKGRMSNQSNSTNDVEDSSVRSCATGPVELKHSNQSGLRERDASSEREEALAMYSSLQCFYMSEAVVFRAILQVLFGWLVRIDTAPPGEDIIVTLKPAFNFGSCETGKQVKSPEHATDATAKNVESVQNSPTNHQIVPDDSDAALVFVVKSKLPNLSPEDATRDGYLESLVADMYRDEDFTMHLDGRFAERWETDQSWKNQLTARRSYAAFLAVTVLGEQNRALQREAIASRSSFQHAK